MPKENDMSEAGLTPEGKRQIEEAREMVNHLPEYPREWQEGYSDEEQQGFDNKLKVTATLKDKEINKLIKKYKRYMKSNITEAKRLES